MDGIWWYTVIPEWDGMDIDSNLRCLSCPPFPSFLFSFSFRSCTTKSTANGWPKRRNFIWTMPRQLDAASGWFGCFFVRVEGASLNKNQWDEFESDREKVQDVDDWTHWFAFLACIKTCWQHHRRELCSALSKVERGVQKFLSFSCHTLKKNQIHQCLFLHSARFNGWQKTERKSDMWHERILLKNPCKPPVSKVSMPCITSSQAPRPCGQGPNDCWRGAIRGRNKNTMARRFQCLKTCKVHKGFRPFTSDQKHGMNSMTFIKSSCTCSKSLMATNWECVDNIFSVGLY